jgi:NADPH:quinone reductase-like Zn-dependent oxidoreductase
MYIGLMIVFSSSQTAYYLAIKNSFFNQLVINRGINIMSKKKVLVLGSTGQVGGQVVKKLHQLSADVEVVVSSRRQIQDGRMAYLGRVRDNAPYVTGIWPR